MLDSELLTQTIAALRERVEGRREEIAQLTEALRREERELQLLTELAHLRGILVEEGSDGSVEEPKSFSDSDSAVGAEPNGSSSLVNAVVAILRENGSPMHIQDLLAKVREVGVPIPGKGSSANLIAHIRGRSEIVRPVRGMYGLPEWGLSDRATVSRATKRTRVGRGKTARRSTRRVRRTAKPAEGRR